MNEALGSDTSHEIAERFVSARRRATGLSAFPGRYPANLDEAYAIQSDAIALWGEPIAGWKVGRLTPDLADAYGVDRFIGPVVASSVTRTSGAEPCDFPVFVGGSAAFEAEYVAVIGKDLHEIPATLLDADLLDIIASLHIGIEIAGSPLAEMPSLDSLASIADMGNNNGQIIGPSVPVDLLDKPGQLSCTTVIDGSTLRSASAADLPGGPLAAIAFALRQAALLGRPIDPGQFISTGAVTGMHWVGTGQRCMADFGEWGSLTCLTVPAESA